ncbi:hypothetical protein [Sinorhizobium meliloti]|uniref:hypothetical protein n=1 Tax=Rhizobium meliloti TaxID=382 RepID=UPI00186592CD|nr:hypothetical protein [Sinorhizobium meliloti]
MASIPPPDTTAGLSAVTTTDAPAATGPYSQAKAVNGQLFVTRYGNNSRVNLLRRGALGDNRAGFFDVGHPVNRQFVYVQQHTLHA